MAAISSQKRHKLKRFIKDLEEIKGRHTELVSVYIPAGYDLNKVTNQLFQEQGTAVNIKSTSTRKNVIDSLEKMLQYLKLYKQTPENGLAIFSGNFSDREGQSDIRVMAIEPPLPLNVRIYRCDKTFILEPLEEMTEVQDIYGMIVMDRRDAIIAILKGKKIITLQKTHSEVPGKMRAGGQSAQRFARLTEGAAKDHYKKVGEYVKEQFLFMNGLKGILVGGPGPTKYDFVDGNYITNEVKQKIITIQDLSYTEEFGLQELLDKSQDVLASEEVADEKKIMTRFFEILAKEPNKAAYGINDVLTKIEMGAVEIVLISECLDDSEIDKIEEKAKEFGSEVKMISMETREGAQLRDIGKVAAILRYAI
ncbi:peptide chain release factor aRF-1 [Candidatus Woesearchaeota archaeon]|nr:peptide chain release factor aRF-1 [Candidatus Woesearchaeota archaeon]